MPHFGTIEMIEAESQVVLNTRTQHDFHDAFKKMAKTLGTVHCMKGDCFKVDGGQ
jgi:hypothetical protein